MSPVLVMLILPPSDVTAEIPATPGACGCEIPRIVDGDAAAEVRNRDDAAGGRPKRQEVAGVREIDVGEWTDGIDEGASADKDAVV